MKPAPVAFAFLSALLLLPFAMAQPDDPDVTVARVSFVGGEVVYERGDVEGWNEARVNTPLLTGDAVFAGEGGRAEVDLGNGTVVRLDGGTQIDLLNNSWEVAQLGMSSGVLDLRTRSFRRGFNIEIDTPSAAVTILEPGHYFVDVRDGITTYSVMRGSIVVAVDGQQLDVREGESLELDDGDPPSYGYGAIASGGPFAEWCDRRDSRYERSSSVRYVNEDVVGCEDLDDHGSWRDVREYGRVWVPANVGPDWAPYRSGRWIWQDPFGWTWVSYEPWGWAPYHYGRWAFVRGYWAWIPPPPPHYRGPAVVMSIRPRYAPALVAFFGGSNWGASLSIGGPAIGWVPLAPAEPYHYPWQAPVRVTNTYVNITVINAVTVVNTQTFATGAVRPIRVQQAQIQRAPVLGSTLAGVTPTRQSLVVTAESAAPARPAPRARSGRPLVARLVPPPKPVQFTEKVQHIERTGKPVKAVKAGGGVGRPFTPSASPQAGAPVPVKPFSARPTTGVRELKEKQGAAAARPPKRIERDITPPPRSERVPPKKNPRAEPPAPPPLETAPASPSPKYPGSPAANAPPDATPQPPAAKSKGKKKPPKPKEKDKAKETDEKPADPPPDGGR